MNAQRTSWSRLKPSVQIPESPKKAICKFNLRLFSLLRAFLLVFVCFLLYFTIFFGITTRSVIFNYPPKPNWLHLQLIFDVFFLLVLHNFRVSNSTPWHFAQICALFIVNMPFFPTALHDFLLFLSLFTHFYIFFNWLHRAKTGNKYGGFEPLFPTING